MNQSRRIFAAGMAVSALAIAGLASAQGKNGADKPKGKDKHTHKNGKDLLGEKIKVNGSHKIDRNGPHTISVDVKDGKIAAFHAKHDKKGELPIKKYKTSKKMAMLDEAPRSPIVMVQYQYVGTTWIGYAYYDDYGNEEIYWYPYDMILDGDTGAIEYVASY